MQPRNEACSLQSRETKYLHSLGSIHLHFIQHDVLDISRKTDKGGIAFIPNQLNNLTATAVIISAAVSVAVREINFVVAWRQRVTQQGEQQQHPLPPDNHDSAQAVGPFATKAILHSFRQ